MSGIINNTNNNILVTFKQEVVYKECLHNHAASLGKVAIDGCYEYLEPNIDNIVDDDGGSQAAFLCAVCNCHRNFHRKQVFYTPIVTVDPETTIIPQSHHQEPNFPATTMAAPEAKADNTMVVVRAASPPSRRKRKRNTNFTDEQVNRLARFAERLGWRTKNTDKEEILNFCLEMGISRRKFAVWLSNNRRRLNANHQTDDLPNNDHEN